MDSKVASDVIMFRGIPSSISLTLRRHEQIMFKNIENNLKELNKNLKELTDQMRRNIQPNQAWWDLHNKIKELTEVIKNEQKTCECSETTPP